MKVKINKFIGTYFTGVSKKKEIVLFPTGGGEGKSRSWMGRGRGRNGVVRRGVGVFVCLFILCFLSESSPVVEELVAPGLEILC